MKQLTSILVWLGVLGTLLVNCHGNPNSNPYIPFRTDPLDQPSVHHKLEEIENKESIGKVFDYDPDKQHEEESQCPLQFSLGISRKVHHGGSVTTKGALGIVQPPVIFPALPSKGPGRQVMYTTQYEHFDMLTPASQFLLNNAANAKASATDENKQNTEAMIKEALVQHLEFPMLFESSSFLTSPVLGDVNQDGIMDAVLTDYDGGIYVLGLAAKQEDGGRRYFHKAQVPRLYVRRQWVESKVNETLGIDPFEQTEEEEEEPPKTEEGDVPEDLSQQQRGKRNNKRMQPPPHDPYHTYFEYTYGNVGEHETVLRGVTSNILGQDHEHVQSLEQRRKRKITHEKQPQSEPEPENQQDGEVTFNSHQDEEQQQGEQVVMGEEQGDAQQQQERVLTEEEEHLHRQLLQEEEHLHRRLQEVVDEYPDQNNNNNNEQQEQEREGERLQEVVDEYPDHNTNNNNEQQEQEREGERSEPEEPVQRSEQEQQQEEGRRSEPEEQAREQEPQQQQEVERQGSEPEEPEQKENQEQQQAGQASEQGDSVQTDGQQQEGGGGEQASEPENAAQQDGGQDTEQRREGGGEGETVPERQDQEERQQRQNDDQRDPFEDDYIGRGDDMFVDNSLFSGDEEEAGINRYGDDDYPRYDDHYARYDDYYGRYDSTSDEYYDEKHYVRIPPHILCTPVLAELPKLYTQQPESEYLLFMAVSYYLDEDEYEGFFSYKRFENTDHGDETEVQRGMYVASAIMIYQFGGTPRWGRQEHLDLSADHSSPVNATLLGKIPIVSEGSQLGAFALSSPTVADIDGDGTMEVIMGTSMGFVYVLDARNLFAKENWPVQLEHSIEHRIVVEDVRGDTNLEMFVMDTFGNVLCLDHKGQKIWHREMVSTVSANGDLVASSPMVLGDVNGDGILDLVLTMEVRAVGIAEAVIFLFALSADTGKTLDNFPVRIYNARASAEKKKDAYDGEGWIHQKMPPPLLVDLHADRSNLEAYIRRNGTAWKKPAPRRPKKPSLGGDSGGLHIVQPYGSTLVIMEAASGCMQSIAIGDQILSMVQADDVHGTNSLDLVVATASGNVVTLESPAPFHPLNVWNNGATRSLANTFAHGYSASQGIFVHEISRQFRDIFGVYIPVTFEIFDNRPNIRNEPDRRVYNVEIRTTSKPVFRKTYNSPGVYTEKLYIPFGPGYYTLNVIMKTTHGLVYEDSFHLGYNVNYMAGFGLLAWLPLAIAIVTILLFGVSQKHWDDDDFDLGATGDSRGILGNPDIE